MTETLTETVTPTEAPHAAHGAHGARGARDTRQVVEELLRCLGAGDLPGVAALFADEIDWRLSWPDEELAGPIPWIRDRRTPDGVLAHFRALAEHNTPHGAGTGVDRIVIDGADAVLLGTIRNVMRRTGTPYQAHFALHLTVVDGRIRAYHIYEDSLAVARAWHGPGREDGGTRPAG